MLGHRTLPCFLVRLRGGFSVHFRADCYLGRCRILSNEKACSVSSCCCSTNPRRGNCALLHLLLCSYLAVKRKGEGARFRTTGQWGYRRRFDRTVDRSSTVDDRVWRRMWRASFRLCPSMCPHKWCRDCLCRRNGSKSAQSEIGPVSSPLPTRD